MTTDSGAGGGGVSVWVWVGGAAAAVLLIVLAIVLFSGGGADETATTTTTTTEATTTTTEATTTTTEAATTTTAPAETTTTAPPTAVVAETPIRGVLQPYGDGSGADLFPPGSVEANWYRWGDLYVVLYRGFDAAAEQQICAGNSIQEEAGFNHVTNSPHLGAADEICVGTARIAEPPSGVVACGSLLYYVTEIPTATEGVLWGTLEIGTAAGFSGQTSQALPDLAATPEFLPDQAAYELPPSDFDDLTIVTCGS